MLGLLLLDCICNCFVIFIIFRPLAALLRTCDLFRLHVLCQQFLKTTNSLLSDCINQLQINTLHLLTTSHSSWSNSDDFHRNSLKPNTLLNQATTNTSNRKYSVLTSFHSLKLSFSQSNLAVTLRFEHFTCLLQVSYFVIEFDSACWIDAFKHTSFLIVIFAFSWEDFHSDSKTGHFCWLIAITVFV